MRKQDLDTPCLIVDLDLMESNIRDMAEYAANKKVNLRPMMKTHKCTAIAQYQMKFPANIGIQTAKVGEAEVMASAGIEDLFISNEIIGESKVTRLVNLAKRGRVSTSVDSIVGAEGISTVAGRHGLTIDVLIHVDTGNRRSGVLPGDPALQLAREVVKKKNIRLKGVWTHEGHNYTGRTPAEVLAKTMKAGQDMVETKKLLEKELGIEIYNSVGSTPGAKPLAGMPGVSEVRPGAYLFQDGSQVFMGTCERSACALSVLATVFSRPASDRAVCDVGSKGYYPPGEWLAFTKEGVLMNWPLDQTGGGILKSVDGDFMDDVVFHRWGEEYGMLTLYDPMRELKIGDPVEVIPYHCCSTVNLYDELVGVRNGEVEVTWPIWARGRMR